MRYWGEKFDDASRRYEWVAAESDGRKERRILENFPDISRQSDCAVTMLTKLSNPPTSMNFQRGKAKVDFEPRGRGGGRGEPAGLRNGESAPLNDLFAVDSETGKTALH